MLPITSDLHQFDNSLGSKEILWNYGINFTIITADSIVFDCLSWVKNPVGILQSNARFLGRRVRLIDLCIEPCDRELVGRSINSHSLSIRYVDCDAPSSSSKSQDKMKS